jgi:lambda repressor-like predicted transcriptional regulator
METRKKAVFDFWRSCGFSIAPIVTAILKETGIRKISIAKQAGCTTQYVNMVLAGSRNSKSVEAAISQALGFNPWAC